MTKKIAQLLFLMLCTSGIAYTQEKAVLAGEELIRALRAGGFNIYFRHAATDWSQTDLVQKANEWISCDPNKIRQLSDEGRNTAKLVGDAIRKLGIPVSKVLSSPYCRTKETAKLMQLGPVEVTTDIMNLRVEEYFGGRRAVARRLQQRLAIKPLKGSNTVLVAHGNVARETTQVYPGEAEGLVFKPNSSGFTFVGRLTADQWIRLAE